MPANCLAGAVEEQAEAQQQTHDGAHQEGLQDGTATQFVLLDEPAPQKGSSSPSRNSDETFGQQDRHKFLWNSCNKLHNYYCNNLLLII